MSKKKEPGLTPAEQNKQMIDEILEQLGNEIVEQLRIHNKIQTIAVEALLDKKIEKEKL